MVRGEMAMMGSEGMKKVEGSYELCKQGTKRDSHFSCCLERIGKARKIYTSTAKADMDGL